MKSLLCLLALLLVFSCRSPKARKPITKKSSHFLKQSAQRNKKLEARQEKHIEKIIQKDSTHTYFTSSNGFWYRYDHRVHNDTASTPRYGDLVNFNYDISTLSGRPIYTRKEIGTRILVIDKETAFPGLRQGLKLMKKGETVTFYFPSFKAYGYYGDADKIGPNVPIRSTVTLNFIKFNHDTIPQTNINY